MLIIYNKNMKNDTWIIQLRKGVFELAILSLINIRPMYGYEITSALNNIPAFEIANGSIYPILKRLTKNNWAISFWEDSIDGPKRKYYQINKEGSKVLKERMEEYKQVYDALMLLGKEGKQVDNKG